MTMNRRRVTVVLSGLWKAAKRVLLLVGLVLTLTFGATWAALKVPSVRSELARKLSALLSAELRGAIHIGSIDRLGLETSLSDVTLWDSQGKVVARLGAVHGQLSLRALLRGNVTLERLRVVRPWLSLHAEGDALAVAQAFLPAHPAPRNTEASTFVFASERGELERGTVVQGPGALSAADVDAHFSLSYSQALGVELGDLHARVARGPAGGANLSIVRSSLRLGVGDRSHFNIALATETDSVRLQGELGWDAEGMSDARANLVAAVSPSGLNELGEHDAAALLAGPLEVQLDVAVAKRGPLMLHTVVTSEAGRVDARAEGHDGSYQVRVRSPRLVLAKLLTLEGLEEAAFDVSATATQGPGQEFAVSVRSEIAHYGELRLPAWQSRLDVSPVRVRVLSLSIPDWTRDRGKVDVAVELRRSGELEGAADLQLTSVALPSARLAVAAVRARARVHGNLSRPAVDAQVSARQLRLASTTLDRLDASVRGGPRDYSIELTANNGRLRAENRYVVTLADVVSARGKTTLSGLRHGPVELTVPAARVGAQSVELENVRAQRGAAVLTLDGRYAFSGTSDLNVRVTELPAGELLDELSIRPGHALSGQLSATAHLHGTLQRPDLSAGLVLTHVRVDDADLGKVSLDVGLSAARRELRTDLNYTGAEGDVVRARVHGLFDAGGAIVERLAAGTYLASLSVRQDLAHLAPLWSTLGLQTPLSGLVQVEGRLAGELSGPEGGVNVKVHNLTVPGLAPVDGELGVELGAQRTWAALSAHDAAGARAAGVLSVDASAMDLARGLTLEGLLETAARVDLDLRLPRLDRLSPALAIDLPVAVTAQAALTTSPRAAPRADLSARATWMGELGTPAGTGAPPELELAATLQQANLRMDLVGELLGKPVLRASLGGHTPIAEWVERQTYRGDLTFVLDVADLDLSALPAPIADASGWLYGNVRAEGLLTPEPHVQANLRLARLAFHGSQPAAVTLQANADAREANLQLSTRVGGRTALRASAQLPWAWDGERNLDPHLQAMHARAELDGMPLEVLLGGVAQVAQPHGVLMGKVAVDGTPDGYDTRGQITIQGAAFTLRRPLIRFENLDANLRLDRASLQLEHLRWADQDGVLTGHGKVDLNHLVPTAAQASFEAKNVPVRRDTLVVAVVDGKVDLGADLTGARDHATVRLRDVAVRLPDQGAHRAQPLEPNPDVVYTDALAPGSPGEESAAASDPLDVEIDASQPFWVRHSDFALQLGAKLQVRSEGGVAYLSGPVRILRGFLNLLGKGFDLQRGLVVFDGGREVDPTLTIDAVHKLADGHTVTVMTRGRASAPELTFTSTVPGVTGSAEALQLLVRGRDNSAAETAQAQMGAALAGLTAGFLSKLTRNKYGKYVPVLSLEAGASSGTRVRAGVEANDLIPPFLRSTVQGVYVEGFVGSQNQGGSRQGAGGVLVELYFPEDIVTGGTWELPNNWSIEATWEP